MTRHAVLLLLVSSNALAAGWTQPAGDLYAKITSSTITSGIAGDAFDTEGEIFTVPESYLVSSVSLYVEYGLIDGLTAVVLGTPYAHASFGDESADYVGLLAGGLRYGMPVGDMRLAAEAHYGYSGAQEEMGGGTVDDTPYVFVPVVKYQQIDGELQLGYPLSFGWAAASLGYRHYIQQDDALDPAVYGSAQVGYISGSFTGDFHLNLHHALGDIEITNVPGAGQAQYLGFGLAGTWWFNEHFGANAGFEGAVYAKSNAATPTLLVGVELKN